MGAESSVVLGVEATNFFIDSLIKIFILSGFTVSHGRNLSVQMKSQPWRKSWRKGEGYEKLSTLQCKVDVDKVSLTQEVEYTDDDDDDNDDQLFTKT
jgi:hypothetical protein